MLGLASFEDRNFASDVEIVHLAGEAGSHHRLRCTEKRPGAMQHDVHTLQHGSECIRIIEWRDTRLESVRRGHRGERFGTTAGNDRTQATPDALFHDELAGVAVGAVNEEHVSRVGSQCHNLYARAHALSGAVRSRRRHVPAATPRIARDPPRQANSSDPSTVP